jgi:myo-inositol-1(or 4)-monophosphatase
MLDEILETAVEAARAGGTVLRWRFGDESLVIDSKGVHDYVSQADRDSEAAVVAAVRRRHPAHRIVAEESGESGGGDGEHEWLIDPLDGTTNFLQGLPVFAVSVACLRRGEIVAGAILDPLRDDLFTACRGGGAFWNGRPLKVSGRPGVDGSFLATGYPFKAKGALDAYLGAFRSALQRAGAIRRCGAAAIDLAYTAAGIYDGFFELRLSPWDLAAGVLLIEEAGGVVSDLDGGDRFLAGGNVVAGNPAVHRELLAIFAEHASEGLVDRLVPNRSPVGVDA